MKKVLSLLLAALLLASCVAALFVVPAGAAELAPTVIYTAGDCTDEDYEHFATVDLALVKANENNRKWKADDVLEIRFDGSFVAGGHNGIKSIINQLGSQDFPRVKIGVGAKPHPDYNLADWVLSTFKKDEMEEIKAWADGVIAKVQD